MGVNALGGVLLDRCLLNVVELEKYIKTEEMHGQFVVRHRSGEVEVFSGGYKVGSAHVFKPDPDAPQGWSPLNTCAICHKHY
jgi:hypothetical protein